MSYIIQKEKKIEVNYRCDVMVAGGGIAGISAALAAARQGSNVILAEQQWMLGGLATAGVVTIFFYKLLLVFGYHVFFFTLG